MSEQQTSSATEGSRGVRRFLLSAWVLLGLVVCGLIVIEVAFPRRCIIPGPENEPIALYSGVESFREKFGSSPPNFDDERRFNRFVTKCLPQSIDKTSDVFARKLDAAESLVFWLSQISEDPRHPFTADATTERYEFFRFSPGRVRDGKYFPKHEGASDAYVYFCWENYDTAEYRGFRPYRRPDDPKTGRKSYCAPETAQIVGPGADGKLGRGGLITELSEEDRDNTVSFSTSLAGEIAKLEGLTQ